jgi:predicted  nucleic acid-binding Zn-ribbon protein
MQTTFGELTTMGLVGFIGILLWQLVSVHRRYNHLGGQNQELDQTMTSLTEELHAALQALDDQQTGDHQARRHWQQRVEALEAEISQFGAGSPPKN